MGFFLDIFKQVGQCYAFVTFKTKTSARLAVQLMNGITGINGQIIRVHMAQSDFPTTTSCAPVNTQDSSNSNKYGRNWHPSIPAPDPSAQFYLQQHSRQFVHQKTEKRKRWTSSSSDSSDTTSAGYGSSSSSSSSSSSDGDCCVSKHSKKRSKHCNSRSCKHCSSHSGDKRKHKRKHRHHHHHHHTYSKKKMSRMNEAFTAGAGFTPINGYL